MALQYIFYGIEYICLLAPLKVNHYNTYRKGGRKIMCFRIGQELSLPFRVVHEYGNAAHLTNGEGLHLFIFPNGKKIVCEPDPNIVYNEKEHTLSFHGLRVRLEDGYEPMARNTRIYKTLKSFEMAIFACNLELIRQTPKEKDAGIYKARLIAMN